MTPGVEVALGLGTEGALASMVDGALTGAEGRLASGAGGAPFWGGAGASSHQAYYAHLLTCILMPADGPLACKNLPSLRGDERVAGGQGEMQTRLGQTHLATMLLPSCTATHPFLRVRPPAMNGACSPIPAGLLRARVGGGNVREHEASLTCLALLQHAPTVPIFH